MIFNHKFIPALKFQWLTPYYDRLISRLMPEKKFKSQLIANATIYENWKILDFGIGTATLSIMAWQTQPDADYTGIDIDEKILQLAKQKIISKNAPINTMLYNGGTLPFDDHSFDRIISSLVIHHLTDEQKIFAFQEFKRILKPQGEVHIADWGKADNLLMRLLFHIVQLLDGYKTTSANVDGRLPDMMLSSGFRDVQIINYFNTLLGTIQIFKLIK